MRTRKGQVAPRREPAADRARTDPSRPVQEHDAALELRGTCTRRSAQNRPARHATPSQVASRVSAASPAGVARLTCLLAPTNDPEALSRLRRAIMVSNEIETPLTIATEPDQEMHSSGKTAQKPRR